MKKTLHARAWIASVLALSILILAVLSGIAYIVDPYFQYRAKDNTYFLTATYLNPGLIKNHEYDTLIVGSGMIGNFNPDQFREELNLNPLKVECGSMGPVTTAAYLNFAADARKAQHYFVNIDLASFWKEDKTVTNEYLMKNDLLSKLQYLLGYETWFRFIPVDCGLMLYKAWVGEFPSGKLSQRTSIDQNGAWTLGEEFGRDIVVNNRETGLYEVSSVELNNLYENMIVQIDSFISKVDFESGSFTFIFPPYSALYWCDAQDEGYLDIFLDAKCYFIQKLMDNNCTVYDFQSADLTRDLDNYKDSTHYCADVNTWMAQCFANGSYQVTQQNLFSLQEKLIENTEIFRSENASLFY